MKKNLLLFIALILFSKSAFCQNLDKEKEKVTYSQLPLNPLPENITQYWQNIDLGYIYSADSKTAVTNSIKNAAVLPHLEKTANSGVQILARLETYYRGEVNYDTEVKTEKRNDKEVKVTYHYLTFDYKYPLYYEVILPGDVDAIGSGFSNGSSEMSNYRSKNFRTRSELNKWWSGNYKTLQAKLRTDLLSKNVSELKNLLLTNYSYRKYSFYPTFYSVKKFKKFDYADLDEAMGNVKEALSSIDAQDVVFSNDFINNMNVAIEIWNKALEESNIEERKTRINKKITEALYNNIYLAYGMLDNFDMAAEVKGIAEDKIDKKAIDNFSERWVSGRRTRFEENEGRIPSSLN